MAIAVADVGWEGVVPPSVVPRMIVKIETETARRTHNFAKSLKKYARMYAPVGDRAYIDGLGNSHPGYLRESIDMLKTPTGWSVVVMADYGIYVNYGTRYSAANPFWHQAIASAKAERGLKDAEVEEGFI